MANGEMTLDVGRIVDVAVAASSRERTDAERARSNQIYGLQTHRHNALEKTVDCTATSTTLVHAERNATFKRINTLNVCRIYSDVAVICNANNDVSTAGSESHIITQSSDTATARGPTASDFDIKPFESLLSYDAESPAEPLATLPTVSYNTEHSNLPVTTTMLGIVKMTTDIAVYGLTTIIYVTGKHINDVKSHISYVQL